jgi:hypothetical protein
MLTRCCQYVSLLPMRIALGLVLLSAACIYACGSSSSSPKGGSAGIGAAGDNSGSAGKGSSDAGANGIGESGAGGDNGVPILPVISMAKPHAAGGLVAGGIIAHSKHFTGVFSLGAAPGGNRISTSASYQLRGGVLGASQK